MLNKGDYDSAEKAVEVVGLYKRYGIPQPDFLKPYISFVTRKSERTDNLPWSLCDINFSLARGQNLGVIGRNGSGKSTLLKVLAGVTPQSRGTLGVSGKIFPMIELSAGTKPELTGSENIKLLMSIMSFSRREISDVYQKVAEFSELGDWLERPVRMYSSGMQARLGMAVALHAEADLILIDEVLGVGDYTFRHKCVQAIESLVRSDDVSIILVSHSPYTVQRLCEKVLLLEKGKQVYFGDTSSGIAKYFNQGEVSESNVTFREEEINKRDGAGSFRFTGIRVLDEAGVNSATLSTGSTISIVLNYRLLEPIANLNVRIRVFDNQNICIASLIKSIPSLNVGHGEIFCDIPSLNLLAGRYTLDLKASSSALQDSTLNNFGFRVIWPEHRSDLPPQQGIVFVPTNWKVI